MKITKLNYLLVIVLALSFAATGCKKKTHHLTPLPAQSGSVGGDQAALGEGGRLGEGEVGGGMAAGLGEFEGMTMDRAALAAYTVHFDYDSAAVKSSERQNVQAVAEALKSDSTVKVLIEGHCDERGTEEYNRSLGDRRALALRQALVKQGVDASRVRTLSYGEDRPVDPGHNEAAWKQNRRGEFVLLRPKM
jgi:peptidoglycan-associated lipoprotein